MPEDQPVRVLVVDLSDPDAATVDDAALHAAVPERERRRQAGRSPRRARPSLTGWLALRFLAAQALGRPSASVAPEHRCPVCAGAHGAPVLPGSGLHLGVAHSGPLVAAAVGPEPLAVDLERGPAEDVRHRVHAPGDPPLPATTAWAVKESVLKLLGTGLRLPPAALAVTDATEHGWTVAVPDGRRARVEPLTPTGVQAAFCLARWEGAASARVRLGRCTLPQLLDRT